MVSKKQTRLKSLSSGRPPTAKSSRSMSRKASRTLINTHHQLEKQRRQAAAKGDKDTESRLASEIAKLGGLDHYQKASLQGQSVDRGGDTSRVLLEWLPVSDLKKRSQPLSMLEHIDLNSQEPGIRQQDFMERPLPKDESELFDIISLSLVLNFVPEAEGRGQMLLRTLSFLRPASEHSAVTAEKLFPCLFVVLPRSCVDNSRYFTETRFEELMTMLGYVREKSKMTQKLAYSLWRRAGGVSDKRSDFAKKEINPGRTRNNFVMTLKASTTHSS
ncbi:25S rRNA (adenine2142-N1)-methyltransferase [Fusarium falciforme]|uniref:25S rRNA adenine-N(1) methyltransferase n=1 Tax=Fusarium falciforme TaxID=195108 RepID=A0A9W8V438_9HYPO|nr:25S rRNA (adenine2142-N1)-methyltransferase [Fusarium falciforme]KAJ4195274.1 25S rRNA (adenine2142-N1)-methyltransferase [Fusarium falciforme]KAJ4251239.1 25S rRNA (adenine2142-N1)-methyltransferase [Fusarium falciforme]